MVNCGSCKYWDDLLYFVPDSGSCKRVDMPTVKLEKNEFHIENDGHLEEAVFILISQEEITMSLTVKAVVILLLLSLSGIVGAWNMESQPPSFWTAELTG